VESTSSSDAVKLHSEVNEYINQKLTILNISITVFGVVMGWLVTGLASVQNGQQATSVGHSAPVIVQPVTVLLPSILLIFLCIMAWYIEAISRQMHILSTYLDVFELSAWEPRYQKLIKSGVKVRQIPSPGLFKRICKLPPNRPHISSAESLINIQSDMPYIILGTLIIFTVIVTFGVCLLYHKELPLRTKYALGYFSLVTLFAMIIFCHLVQNRDLTSFRKNVRQKWQSIKKQEEFKR
jgi:hypothetical protein